jgi:hypothetical protein
MFGKKEDKSHLPDLPPSPVPLRKNLSGVPNKDQVMSHDSSLPTFPDKPMTSGGFSQSAIKGAVGSNEEDFIGQAPKKMGVVEMEEWRPNNFEKQNMRPFPGQEKDSDDFGDDDDDDMQPQRIAPPPKVQSSPPPAKEMRPQDVYVRIDKFHSARKALTDVKEKLQEVDDFVRKIREIKMREEQELDSWEKDIMHIKTRVQHVSENIFEKVE